MDGILWPLLSVTTWRKASSLWNDASASLEMGIAIERFVDKIQEIHPDSTGKSFAIR